MVGLGENEDDTLKTLEDLKATGVDIVVVEQFPINTNLWLGFTHKKIF